MGVQSCVHDAQPAGFVRVAGSRAKTARKANKGKKAGNALHERVVAQAQRVDEAEQLADDLVVVDHGVVVPVSFCCCCCC